MSSQFEQLLESLQWTFDTHVKPAVEGSLAQSYARTVSVLLAQARDRAREEQRTLHEDLADLRDTLAAVRDQLPMAAAAQAEAVLARIAPPPAFTAPDQLERDLAELDALAVVAITTLPPAARAGLEAFTVRRIERRRRWLPDNAPKDAF